jgi:HEAT repeat protein
VRHAAAIALGACSSRHPDAARALARQARADQPDAAVAAVVINAVGADVFGSLQRTVEFLAVAASHEDPLVRRLSLDALGGVESSGAAGAVAFALTDEEPEVQLAAARALGKMRDGEGRAVGVSHLLEVIRDSLDEGLALAALEALGHAGDPVALEDLKRVAKEGAPMRAVVAVEAIGRLNAPDRYDALAEMLRQAEAEVVKAALSAMARTDDPRVELHLGSCLAHDAWDVRRLSADLLGHRGGAPAKKLLQDRLSIEEEPLVREAIRRSLAEAEGLVGVRHTVPPPAFGGGSE